MTNYEFMHPYFLILLLALPLLWWYKYKRAANKTVKLKLPHVSSFTKVDTWKTKLNRILPYLKILAIAAFIIALARPRSILKEEEVKAEGIDIMLVMDLSSSMLARDFDPNRLEVSKQTAIEFIEKRPYDRIGLVVFAGESFTQSPLTTDHRIVKDFLSSLESGILEDGTAIGMGLASAVNRLKTSESDSKVVILLTDGVNNKGYIKPMTAAEIAKELNVKVYTIGVGTMGNALSPVSRRQDGRYIFDIARVEIDEELLAEISKLTGARYYRATDENSLAQIYSEIDALEKTEIEVKVYKKYTEEFRFFLLLGFIALTVEWLLRNSILKRFPE